MKLSIISPCFNEELNLPLFFETLNILKKKLKKNFKIEVEIIVVDDCSDDDSRDIILKFSKKYKYIKPVFNPRNFGVYRSAYAGLKFAEGDIVTPMFPVDMQDPPDVLYKIVAKKIELGVTGVFGRKVNREEALIMRLLRNLFYSFLYNTSKSPINKNVGEFGVLERWVVDECLKRNDYYPYLRGIFSNITSDFYFINYTWKKRIHGKSKHNFLSLYDHGVNAIISSGSMFFRPLVFFGFFVSICSLLFSALNLGLYFFNVELFSLSGIPSLLILTSFFFGFILAFLGFIGEYIVAIHSQVRGFDRVINKRFNDK